MSNAGSSRIIDAWLARCFELGGSDVHLSVGSPPRIRVGGLLQPCMDLGVLQDEDLFGIVEQLLDENQRDALKQVGSADFAFDFGNHARVRASVYRQRGALAVAFRMIPSDIPNYDELGIPQPIRALGKLSYGLVLITGPTGSGKSTTLAAVVDDINTNRDAHIITLEDPIEFMHRHKRSLVHQREVGRDSSTFAAGLRAALREDPDVILLGEMRDLESIQIALTMAETGHLVLATLHTNDAPQAIDRIIDVFPAESREQIRVQLGASLVAVIAQRLVLGVDERRRAVYEVLLATSATRNLIREGKTNQLRNIMTTQQVEGMCTLEMSLLPLIAAGQITLESALAVSQHPKELIQSVAMQPKRR